MTALALAGVTRSFGGILAADHVDFTLSEAELHCLIGPNGAGKSTLFKLVMGLVKPQAGRILLGDIEITQQQPYERVRLGLAMKYQTTRVFAGLTVAQNITVAQRKRRTNGGLMSWALRHFGLDDRLEQPAGALSYGEQHWLEMCMVLGNDPRVVLMDEPTAGMTPEETAATADFLEQLNGRGVGVVVIEHDMGFVRMIARRVTVLHQGRIFRQATLPEIERDPEVQRIYLGEQHE